MNALHSLLEWHEGVQVRLKLAGDGKAGFGAVWKLRFDALEHGGEDRDFVL
jgi:hypothetical protein